MAPTSGQLLLAYVELDRVRLVMLRGSGWEPVANLRFQGEEVLEWDAPSAERQTVHRALVSELVGVGMIDIG